MNIIIKYINIVGIGFTVTSEEPELRKIYNMSLEAVLPEKDIKVNLNIIPIGAEKDSKHIRIYRAVYQELTDAQFTALSEIVKHFEKKKNRLMIPFKLSGTLSEIGGEQGE
jgi:hypothetical protein